MQDIKKTSFYQFHVDSGAVMVNFHGWRLPVRYTGDKEEHNAVRERAGLFDVSHMGEFIIKGEKALPLLQYICSNNVAKLHQGKVQYNVLVSPEGGAIDDLLVYKIQENEYFLVVNAANTENDYQWILENNKKFGADIENVSEQYSQLALQGPKAIEILQNILSQELNLKYFNFIFTTLADKKILISRTGYTGSDGYELYFLSSDSAVIWERFFEHKDKFLLCGLGARDSLRIEGKLMLHGNEIDKTTNILYAGLGNIINWEKGEFIGRDVLLKTKQEGLAKKLIGFQIEEMAIARSGYEIFKNDRLLGKVTSGTFSPFFNKAIGLAYLPREESNIGNIIDIKIRKKMVAATIVATPFYKK